MRAFRHRAIACCLALAALATSACGANNSHNANAAAENNGVYVHLDGISYQLQVSRELNQYSNEDSQYLAGLPQAQASVPGELWYGVFLRAINEGHQTQTTSASFDIYDTQGHVYHPVPLPSTNQYAWVGRPLAPNGIEPAPDTTAYFGPTQGGLVLFKLPTSVYANRPLTLDIYGTGGQTDKATISLDL